MTNEYRAALQDAAFFADWQQVVCNQGPPCFHLEGTRFCLRAERWAGHGGSRAHVFVSLADLITSLLARPEPQVTDEQARLEQLADRLTWPQPIRPDLDAAEAAIRRELIRLRQRPEPAPRITREEAMRLLHRYQDALLNIDVPIDKLNQAFEACLAAMLRPEPAPSARPEPQTQTIYVFLQQRPRDKQPFPLVYVDQQLAEAAPHRVTPVVAVDVPMLPSPPDAEAAR